MITSVGTRKIDLSEPLCTKRLQASKARSRLRIEEIKKLQDRCLGLIDKIGNIFDSRNLKTDTGLRRQSAASRCLGGISGNTMIEICREGPGLPEKVSLSLADSTPEPIERRIVSTEKKCNRFTHWPEETLISFHVYSMYFIDLRKDERLPADLLATYNFHKKTPGSFVISHFPEIINGNLRRFLGIILDRKMIEIDQMFFALSLLELSKKMRSLLVNQFSSKDRVQSFYEQSVLLMGSTSEPTERRVVSKKKKCNGLICLGEELLNSEDLRRDQYLSVYLCVMVFLDPEKIKSFVTRYFFEIISRNLKSSVEIILNYQMIDPGQIYSALLSPGLSEDMQVLLIDGLNLKNDIEVFYRHSILLTGKLSSSIQKKIINDLLRSLNIEKVPSLKRYIEDILSEERAALVERDLLAKLIRVLIDAEQKSSIQKESILIDNLKQLLRMLTKENLYEEVNMLLRHMKNKDIHIKAEEIKKNVLEAWENNSFRVVAQFCALENPSLKEEAKNQWDTLGITQEELETKLELISSNHPHFSYLEEDLLICLYMMAEFGGNEINKKLFESGIVERVVLSTNDPAVYLVFIEFYLSYVSERSGFIIEECERISGSDLDAEDSYSCLLSHLPELSLLLDLSIIYPSHHRGDAFDKAAREFLKGKGFSKDDIKGVILLSAIESDSLFLDALLSNQEIQNQLEDTEKDLLSNYCHRYLIDKRKYPHLAKMER